MAMSLLVRHFDVLRATPHALLIARQGANRERASLFGGVGANALINIRVALEDYFEYALPVAGRVDHIMNMRRNAIVRVRRRFDGAVVVGRWSVRGPVTCESW